MNLRELWLRITYPFRRGQIDRDLRDEMALHVAMRAEQMRAEDRGVSEGDAVVAARRQFGNSSRIASASRDAWGWHWLDGFGQDLRYVGRQLRRTPAFAAVAAITIALGIGINAAAFTFYDAIVFKPLPVSHPERMVRVIRDLRVSNPEELQYSAYQTLRKGATTTESVVALTGPQSLPVVLPGRAPTDERLVVARFVSDDFFRSLDINPPLGRWITAGDDRVVVLDHGFWTTMLAADPRVIGQRITIHGQSMTVVGVAPEKFAGTGLPAAAPDLWLPADALPIAIGGIDWRRDDRAHWQVLARLAPASTFDRFTAELASLRLSIPDSVGRPTPLVAKHATFFQTDAGEFDVFQQVSAALMVALTLILAIAAVNLINLFAARNTAREREVTVRLALGASRARIARQLAGESVLLAVVGGAIGLVASQIFARWARTWLVETMSTVTGNTARVFIDIGVDWRVSIYATILAGAIGIAVGLWPALRSARADVNSILRQGSASTAGAAAWTTRNLLLASQVAGCLILLTSAGMLLGGMRRARAVDPGFDAAHMLVVYVDDRAATPDRRVSLRNEIQRQIADLPEVRAIAWTKRVPFAGTHLRSGQTPLGQLTLSMDDVSETYFDAMGLPIIQGRSFTKSEVASKAPVLLVSASLARLRWPGADPVGRSVPPKDFIGGADTVASYTVIGVVPDIRSQFLSRVNSPSAYYPQSVDSPFGAFLVQTRGAPESAINAVRIAVGKVQPTLATQTHAVSMERGPMSLQRLTAQAPATVAIALALTGLALAGVGVYGLIAQIVARRTREIGIHVALGARPHQVIALVMRKTMRPVAWGLGIGAAGALGVSILLRAVIATPDAPDLTFGAGAFNPLVFLGVLQVLALAVLAACWLPARRAMKLNPTDALRAE